MNSFQWLLLETLLYIDDFRHQRRLVNMLGKIEKSVIAESQENPVQKPGSKPRSSTDGPMRAVHRSVSKVM